jgi:hypothetical protein
MVLPALARVKRRAEKIKMLREKVEKGSAVKQLAGGNSNHGWRG